LDLARARLVIGHLYPDLLNIYGDRGNVLALCRRAAWRGVGQVEVRTATVGEPFDLAEVDLLCMGGGEDAKQALAAADLQRRRDELAAAVASGLPVLAVCGSYQLLGAYYQLPDGSRLPGAGVLDAYTVAGERRLVGNVVVETDLFGAPRTLVGFENHAGCTYLGPGARPLGRVRVGHGNHGRDGSEGAVCGHCVGTYLHGSLLPKNPALADWLLLAALRRRYGEVAWPELDDDLEERAHAAAVRRARETARGDA
jgi:CobQ-like glutamine amidotransferase family enzyme